MAEPPQTAEGWYVLHDFRRVDWDAWRDAPERDRDAAVEAGVEYLRNHEAVADAPEGDSGAFTVLGNEADLLFVHFRPTLEALDRAQRRFEGTALAGYTERAESFVSVTEVSGYVSDDYFTDPESVDEGTKRYIEGKLSPEIPDDGYVSVYPMRKRRDPEYNWYDLPFDERADLMAGHGDVGREFAGRISQVIASCVGLDDWEWTVTLFGDDPTDLKDIVYEMRFDEASSKYGDFGDFYVGSRLHPDDLAPYLAGEAVPDRDAPDDAEDADAAGGPPTGDRASSESEIRQALADLDVYAGQPNGEDVYALVLYSEADPDDLAPEVFDLRESFEHYDTHVKTAVYAAADADRAAVVSVWDTASAADTASGFLADLPGIVGSHGDADGWGTMGMFYTVKPEHRTDFVEKFDDVADLLADMDGHRETLLLANHEDENDMFIASQWRAKADAMEFFGSDAFRDTVSWGRDVLADRPRHVFLA